MLFFLILFVISSNDRYYKCITLYYYIGILNTKRSEVGMNAMLNNIVHIRLTMAFFFFLICFVFS